MKKYDLLMAGTLAVYLCLTVLFYAGFGQKQAAENQQYKVEINEVMQELQSEWEQKALEQQEQQEQPGKQGKPEGETGTDGVDFIPDISGYRYLQGVSYLSAEEAEDVTALTAFYQNHNGVSSSVVPLVLGNEVKGFVRFDYKTETKMEELLWLVEGVLFLIFCAVMALLVFIRYQILKPFQVLSGMPYELAKGHLQGELEESKSRFFGRFVWGIAMLRDALNDSRAKELKLLKEKKLLLLSISHDIKIPLGTIKLYAKALWENVYDTEEKRCHAAGQIEAHAKEIEDFIGEIIRASSEEVLVITVENSEFYLKNYVDKIKEIYVPKCGITLTEFEIGDYENRMLKGDMDRAVEVMENLIENAFKYGDGLRISIDFYEEDYCQVIRVFNSGNPVSATEMPHLFDSFYRGSNASNQPGNGLGLYINRQIMRKMEGDIFAERREDGMSFGLVFRM